MATKTVSNFKLLFNLDRITIDLGLLTVSTAGPKIAVFVADNKAL